MMTCNKNKELIFW